MTFFQLFKFFADPLICAGKQEDIPEAEISPRAAGPQTDWRIISVRNTAEHESSWAHRG